jgi:beta-lactamase regulating signal transducer with metallopeptidase domain
MMNYFWHAASLDKVSLEVLTLLAGSTAKAIVLLSCVSLFCLAFRRGSAAMRHLLWTFSLFGSLLLAVLSTVSFVQLPILPSQSPVNKVFTEERADTKVNQDAVYETTKQNDSVVSVKSNQKIPEILNVQTPNNYTDESLSENSKSEFDAPPQSFTAQITQNWASLALAVWMFGAIVFLFRLSIGFAGARLVARRATRFKDESLVKLFAGLLIEFNLKSSVKLLRSESVLMPIVCGILRPAVLLPASADTWSEERRRIVLLHELTHVKRRDCLVQVMAQTVCAFYWFNPLIWYAARHLRVERERACDDYVISLGTKPSDYAFHLLEIARLLRERSIFEWTQTTTVAMARQSQLEGRLLAILDKEGKSRVISRVKKTGVFVLIFGIFFSLAVLHPTAQNMRNIDSSITDERTGNELLLNSQTTTGLILNDNTKIENDNTKIENVNSQMSETQVSQTETSESLKVPGLTKFETESNVQPNVERVNPLDIVETTVQSKGKDIQEKFEPETQSNIEAAPLIKSKYQPELISERQEKSQDFIDEMASVGYTNLSVGELNYLKTNGVTADYVKGLRVSGFNKLAVREIGSLAIQYVTPAYIQEIRAAGYNELTPKDLVTFRVHQITPEYIKTFRDAGYFNLSLKQLVQFRVHNVTPKFISEMRSVGFSNLFPKEIVSLRNFAITPEFVRQARSRFGELTYKQIISLRNTGIFKDNSDTE